MSWILVPEEVFVVVMLVLPPKECRCKTAMEIHDRRPSAGPIEDDQWGAKIQKGWHVEMLNVSFP